MHRRTRLKEYVKLINNCRSLEEARRLDGLIATDKTLRKQGAYIDNLVVEMYGKCGSVDEAKRVFDSIPVKNSISFRLMLKACMTNKRLDQARSVLSAMPSADAVSCTSVVTGFANLGQMQEAKEAFDKARSRDFILWSALLASYAKNGCLQEANLCLEKMPSACVVAWTALFAAYAQKGHVQEAHRLFCSMPERDAVSWMNMAAAFARHGDVRSSAKVLEFMPLHTLPASNVMLAGLASTGQLEKARYAQGGHARCAIDWFYEMQVEGVDPDSVAFLWILVSCCHVGGVKDVRSFFRSMVVDYGISPTLDHYSSVVDSLGRAGHLEQAEELIESMPFLPDGVVWHSLLAACKNHKDVERAARASKHALAVNPSNSLFTYVLLDNAYRS